MHVVQNMKTVAVLLAQGFKHGDSIRHVFVLIVVGTRRWFASGMKILRRAAVKTELAANVAITL